MADERFVIFERREETADGANRDEIALVFREDGGIIIDGVYSGPAAEAFWGDWDHEFRAVIAPEQARAFVATVFRAAFSEAGLLTHARLLELAAEAGIKVETSDWT